MAAELALTGDVNGAAQLFDHMKRNSYSGPVGLAAYHVARGEIEQAVEAAILAVEQRFPAFIGRVIRTYEPLLRQSASWQKLLTAMNLA
jgi:hypothetical protein